MFDQKLDQFITDDDVQVNNKNISKYTYWKCYENSLTQRQGSKILSAKSSIIRRETFTTYATSRIFPLKFILASTRYPARISWHEDFPRSTYSYAKFRNFINFRVL